MRPRSLLLAAASVAMVSSAACEMEMTLPPDAPAASSSAAMSPPTPSSVPAPAHVVTAEPTVLADADRARDDAYAGKLAPIVDAYSNLNGAYSTFIASITRDGKHVLFGSNREGVPEVYLGDAQKPAEARAITKGPERAKWAALSRDEKFVLFTRDEGADENFRIYKVALDGSGLTNLTPGEKLHRDEPVLPRNKPDLIIYSAHSLAEPATRVITQTLGGEPTTVYKDPLPGEVADATADGAHALLMRIVSASEIIVVDVDVKAGTAKRVYPAEGKQEAINAAAYSADGSTIFVATDEGGEHSSLIAIDAKTAKEKARYKQESPPAAIVGAVSVSPSGDRVAIQVDAGNHMDVRILDAKTLKKQATAATPLGWVALGSFTDDGKRLTIGVSPADKPVDIFAVDAATGAVKPLRDDKRAGMESLPPLVTTIENVAAFDGLTIPVNLYLPKREPGKKLPAIVMVHGGPESSAPIRWNPTVRFFASLGYALVEPNIRGSTGFGRAYEMADNREKRGDAMKDLESVNRWVKAEPWSDPARVVVFGGSYGGYMTLMALTRQPGLWRAGVDLFGIADLKTFMKTTDPMIRSLFVEEFGDLEKDAALLDEFSPIRDKDKITVPLFVYAGANDPRVPKTESDIIVKALRERNIPVEYMVAKNEGHSVDHRETKLELYSRVARFLEDRLK